LAFDVSFPSSWRNPHAAWQHLKQRCDLSQLSLNWCLQMAKEVCPEPSARSLFDNPAELEVQLLDIVTSPLVMTNRRATGAAG
jgi:hypothetical protein